MSDSVIASGMKCSAAISLINALAKSIQITTSQAPRNDILGVPPMTYVFNNLVLT